MSPVLWPFAVEVGISVAATVSGASEHEARHSDIRPANISFSESGQPALAPAQAGDPGADPADDAAFFVAPELVLGGDASDASDVYALGATVLTAIIGRRPDLHDADWRDELTRLGVPSAVSAVMSKALSLSPTARYRTPADFGSALAAARGEPVTAPFAAVTVAPIAEVIPIRPRLSPIDPPTALLPPIALVPHGVPVGPGSAPPPVRAPAAGGVALSADVTAVRPPLAPIDPPSALLPPIGLSSSSDPDEDYRSARPGYSAAGPVDYLGATLAPPVDGDSATELISARPLPGGPAFEYPVPSGPVTAAPESGRPERKRPQSSAADTEADGFGALPTLAALGYGGGAGPRSGHAAFDRLPDGRPSAAGVRPARAGQAKRSVRLGIVVAAAAAVLLLAIGGWALATGGHHHPQSNDPAPAPASSTDLGDNAVADDDSPTVAGPTATMPTITGPNLAAVTSPTAASSTHSSTRGTSTSPDASATSSIANPSSPAHPASTPAKTKPVPSKTPSQNPVVPPPIVTSPSTPATSITSTVTDTSTDPTPTDSSPSAVNTGLGGLGGLIGSLVGIVTGQ